MRYYFNYQLALMTTSHYIELFSSLRVFITQDKVAYFSGQQSSVDIYIYSQQYSVDIYISQQSSGDIYIYSQQSSDWLIHSLTCQNDGALPGWNKSDLD